MRNKNNSTRHLSKWTFSLKGFLLTVLIPITLLITGTIFLSTKINGEVRAYTQDLEQETVNNVLLAQRNSTNLQSLSNSLQDLVYASAPERARHAFVNAWGMLSGSSFVRHEHTKESTERLLDSLNQTWQIRKKYDSKRLEINQTFRNLYFHLLMASGVAAGLHATSIDLLQVPAQRFVLHFDDGDQHKCHLEDLRVAFRGLCSNAHVPMDSARAAHFKEHCQAIRPLPAKITEGLAELATLKNEFLAFVQVMNADALNLRQEYSVIETSDLLQTINQTNRFYEKILSTFFMSLLVAIAVTLLLGLSFYLLMSPLIDLSGQMRQFLATNEMPKLRSTSRIREINDVLKWLMHFCELIREKRQRETELTQQYDRLLISSHLDTLTGLSNRKALEEYVKSEKEVAANTCVLMLDIDHFKLLNDTLGHLFGDHVLSVFGRHLQQSVTRKDRIFRYGGEEFCIFLSDVTPRSARETAEYICRRVGQISRNDASVCNEGRIATDPLTVSIGMSSVTAFTGHVDAVTLIREADVALYKAKRSGRNCVCHFARELTEEVSRQGISSAPAKSSDVSKSS